MTPTERIALLKAAVRFVQLVHVPEMRGADGYSIRAGYLLALAEDGSMWTGEEHGYGPWVCTRTIADRLRAPEGEAVGGAQAPPYAAVNEAFDAARGSHPTLRAVMAERTAQSPPAEPSEETLRELAVLWWSRLLFSDLQRTGELFDKLDKSRCDAWIDAALAAWRFYRERMGSAPPLSVATGPTQEQIAEIIERERATVEQMISAIIQRWQGMPLTTGEISDGAACAIVALLLDKAAPPIPADLIERARKIEARWRLGPYDHNADITDLVRDIAALGAGGGEA